MVSNTNHGNSLGHDWGAYSGTAQTNRLNNAQDFLCSHKQWLPLVFDSRISTLFDYFWWSAQGIPNISNFTGNHTSL